MAQGRNWLTSLWRTSYKGAAFWVETDEEAGGRRVVIHEFPMRDTPFLEDLGERFREFTVTAYVASDKADSEASTLTSVCATRGAGVLVLPTQGPVTVRCTEFSREFAKDRLGYIAHRLHFVREGFGSSLASVASLANLVYVAAEDLAAEAAVAYARAAILKDVPDYVAQSLQDATENALATLEVVRTSVNVEPAASAAQRDAIEATFVALSEAMSTRAPAAPQSPLLQVAFAKDPGNANTDVMTQAAMLRAVGRSVADVALALVENTDASQALAAMEEVISTVPAEPIVATSKWRFTASINQFAAHTLLRVSALAAYCESVVRVKLGDRPAAITLRANVSRYFEEQLEALPSEDYELFHALVKMRDTTIDYLSRAVLDLAPVVKVSSSVQMPSLYWSWRLYGDANRGQEIVDRNRVAHPSFIPVKFEALAK
jgi:prophage DNA circulation protein